MIGGSNNATSSTARARFAGEVAQRQGRSTRRSPTRQRRQGFAPVPWRWARGCDDDELAAKVDEWVTDAVDAGGELQARTRA